MTEKQSGKIRNRDTGLEIPVENVNVCVGYWWAQIAGDGSPRDFGDKFWEFIPDLPPLPTKPGVYQRRGRSGPHDVWRMYGVHTWIGPANVTLGLGCVPRDLVELVPVDSVRPTVTREQMRKAIHDADSNVGSIDALTDAAMALIEGKESAS